MGGFFLLRTVTAGQMPLTGGISGAMILVNNERKEQLDMLKNDTVHTGSVAPLGTE